MNKFTLATISLGAVGVLALSGCSSSDSAEGEPTPVATEVVEEVAPTTPASVQGPEWCGDVYAVYTGTVETPNEAGALIASAAEKAGGEPTAQEALTGMAEFLEAQDPNSETQIAPEELEKFNTLDSVVNEQFAQYCGGKSIVDTIMEEYSTENPDMEIPSEDGAVVEEETPSGE